MDPENSWKSEDLQGNPKQRFKKMDENVVFSRFLFDKL